MKPLKYLDFFQVFVLLALMSISLIAISSVTLELLDQDPPFWTPYVWKQLRWFFIGWVIYFLCCLFDYGTLKNYAPVLYCALLLLLTGLFLMPQVHNVYRWYRIPGIGFDIQPSELSKIVIVIILAWFIDRNKNEMHTFKKTCFALILGLIPCVLVLKQPDLGTALILFFILFGMLVVARANRFILKTIFGFIVLCFLSVSCIFLGAIPHERVKPFAAKFVKEYQFERLNPNSYHQKASLTALGLGSYFGSGFRKNDFSTKKWLPAAHTDSVFCAIGEQFGIFGMYILIGLFYLLGYLGFRSASYAKDHFGMFLGFGITLILIVHTLLNIAMMLGILPISGVPLVLISYGGSQILVGMLACGLLQSIYIRRFRF
jgi:rod shape determining protein RodA